VTRVLLRGLHPKAAKRWPDMDTLTAALERARSSRRVVVAAIAAAAVIALGAVFVLGRHAATTGPSCDGAAAPVADAWPAAAVHGAFAATHAPYAEAAFTAVNREVEAWRGRWRSVAVESCRATREHGTQSEAMLDLRTACLARARDGLRTLGDALVHADASLVEKAPALATRLPELGACDAVALAGVAPPPPDPHGTRQLIETALTGIERDTMHGLSLDGAKALLPVARVWATAATTRGWQPLVARADRAIAMLEEDLGQGKEARTSLLAAMAAAQGDDLAAIELDLLDLEGRITSDWALAESWAKLAEATLGRLGERPATRVELARRHGLAL
jgi:hypothetical protein